MINNPGLEKKLWVESFRYSLSRRTYATGEFCDYFKKYFEDIPFQARELIFKELEKTKARDGWVGDDCDKQEWLDLVDWITKTSNSP
ncbi:hypothetical protein Xen7305DRAFT_00008990 [Xenococcus sp. PCC 7305]|uniref:hypothetical protein n=1 Tax=Xenococcus sp. PCC 7305 TaxID=102125 RepID=UPI0002AC7AED|nr:hypothetical protein [Xenococcus sp. PCC 7305]ELS01197.1 hypothetical protein Xen7305DRAFT_00008990 [Xenococcus sp. PCC 7305]